MVNMNQTTPAREVRFSDPVTGKQKQRFVIERYSFSDPTQSFGVLDRMNGQFIFTNTRQTVRELFKTATVKTNHATPQPIAGSRSYRTPEGYFRLVLRRSGLVY